MGTSLVTLQFVFSFLLFSGELVIIMASYPHILSKEQLEPPGISVGCFVSQGFECGKPCPKCRSPGNASLSEASGFQWESRSVPTTGSCGVSDSRSVG